MNSICIKQSKCRIVKNLKMENERLKKELELQSAVRKTVSDQLRYVIEKNKQLDKALDKSCGEIASETNKDCRYSCVPYDFVPTCYKEEGCKGNKKDCCFYQELDRIVKEPHGTN